MSVFINNNRFQTPWFIVLKETVRTGVFSFWPMYIAIVERHAHKFFDISKIDKKEINN